MKIMNPRKKPAPVKVRAEWFPLYTKRGKQMMFWGIVGQHVKARGVRSTDADGIRTICREVDAMMTAMQARGQQHGASNGRST